MASQELNQALWNAANVMRSTMSADEYKDYLLGMMPHLQGVQNSLQSRL